MADKDDFTMVRVAVICRNDRAMGVAEAMLDASNAMSVYCLDNTRRLLTDEEWEEVKEKVPAGRL